MRLPVALEVLLVTALVSSAAASDQERVLHREKRQFGVNFGFPNFNQFGQTSSTGRPGRQEPNQNVDLGQVLGSVVGGFLNPQSQNQNNNILGAVAGLNQALNPGTSGNCGSGNGGCEQGCQEQGRFTRCFCNAGYVLNRDRRTCSDINECIFGNAGCRHICNNTPGSFQCSCANGFTLQADNRSCAPGQTGPVEPSGGGGGGGGGNVGFPGQPGGGGLTSSCANNNGGCEQECAVNDNNSTVCRCGPGYQLNSDDKKTCVDVDECARNDSNGGCSDVCTNTVGSYTCSCNGDLVLNGNGKNCIEPPLSCDDNNGGCEQKCILNDKGRAVCRCNPGYRLNQDDKKTCVDVDECTRNDSNGGCSDVCTNTIGSFTCSCNGDRVLNGNGKKCVDPGPGGIDGGTTESCDNNNGGCEQICRTRRNGSIRCRCRRGFTLSSDRVSCTADPTEPPTSPGTSTAPFTQACSVQNGGCEQQCQQTFQGVRCFCTRGYTLQNDGRSCADVNECRFRNGGCSDVCDNAPGSYSCSCSGGAQLQQNGFTCFAPPTPAPGPNCNVNNGGCEQLCSAAVSFGASPCSCTQGYTLNNDGFSCSDINECQQSNGGCEQTCQNRPGTFLCRCMPGFTLVGGNACRADVTTGPPSASIGSCGVNTRKRINMNTRIVGGKPSNPRDWPWMVALLQTRNTAQFCGGALITSRHVLTAAHCVTQFTAADITIRVGEYDFTLTTDNNPSDFKIASIEAHEQYDTMTQENDIAILRLQSDVPFNEFVQPVCLPPPDNQNLAGLNAIVTGWGTTSFGGSVSNVLREVQIPIWTKEECEAAYPGKVFPLMMCAGIRAGGKDSCQGDSGGPLVTQYPSSGTWYVVGVVSWGIECARADRPGVYSRVNQYLPWIAQKTSR